jgi:hypothetical protein
MLSKLYQADHYEFMGNHRPSEKKGSLTDFHPQEDALKGCRYKAFSPSLPNHLHE